MMWFSHYRASLFPAPSPSLPHHLPHNSRRRWHTAVSPRWQRTGELVRGEAVADSAKIRCSPRSFFAKDNGRCTGLSMVKKRQRRVVAALLHARRLTSCSPQPPASAQPLPSARRRRPPQLSASTLTRPHPPRRPATLRTSSAAPRLRSPLDPSLLRRRHPRVLIQLKEKNRQHHGISFLGTGRQ